MQKCNFEHNACFNLLWKCFVISNFKVCVMPWTMGVTIGMRDDNHDQFCRIFSWSTNNDRTLVFGKPHTQHFSSIFSSSNLKQLFSSVSEEFKSVVTNKQQFHVYFVKPHLSNHILIMMKDWRQVPIDTTIKQNYKHSQLMWRIWVKFVLWSLTFMQTMYFAHWSRVDWVCCCCFGTVNFILSTTVDYGSC